MSDALWNGIIGAGGAAICCAVYYGFKFIKNKVSKINHSKKETMQSDSSHYSSIQYQNVNCEKTDNQITINIPSKRQLFTKTNVRALGYIIICIVCLCAANETHSYWSVSDGTLGFYEGDFYTNISHNCARTATNTYALFHIIQNSVEYIFYIAACVFGLLGITSFSFKK